MQPSQFIKAPLGYGRFALCVLCLIFMFVDGKEAQALTFKSGASIESQTQNETTSKKGKLSKSEAIMSYDIVITSAALEGLKRLPFEFDFSQYDIWTDMPEVDCSFEIQRRPIEDRRIEVMGSGRLNIKDGIFTFGRNNWRTRGMSDPSYLQDEANLRLLKDGSPIGKMPYFHLFINQGEVARPPEYVELNKGREKGDNGNPEGIFRFYVDDWQEGLISIRYCRPPN